MANQDIEWGNWEYCDDDDNDLPIGGLNAIGVTQFKYLDPTSFVFDAKGCLTAWSLLPDAPFIYFKPKTTEATTRTIAGARDTPESVKKYTKNFILEIPDTKDTLVAESILCSKKDLVVFVEDNCCVIEVHGLRRTTCAGTVVTVADKPQPLRLNESLDDAGNYNGSRSNTWTISGIGLNKKTIVNMTPAALEALKTNCVTP